MPPAQAIFELISAGAIWGFGFVAAKWCFLSLGAHWVSAIRFLGAFLVGLPLVALVAFRSGKRTLWLKTFWLAAPSGALLGLTLTFQTVGLQYTTATRCGFITGLYVIFVPLVESLSGTLRVSIQHWLWVGVAILGAALLCDVQEFDLNVGDALTLACAFCAALQILYVQRVVGEIQSPLAFNVLQCLPAGMLALVFSLTLEPVPWLPWNPLAVAGMVSLMLGSTLLAFFLQIRSQRFLAPTIVSMLFLLEAPFSAFFGFLVLGESLGIAQFLGAGLILVACTGTIHTVNSGKTERTAS